MIDSPKNSAYVRDSRRYFEGPFFIPCAICCTCFVDCCSAFDVPSGATGPIVDVRVPPLEVLPPDDEILPNVVGPVGIEPGDGVCPRDSPTAVPVENRSGGLGAVTVTICDGTIGIAQ